jgi:cytochrome c-type biogenesis protein CcmH
MSERIRSYLILGAIVALVVILFTSVSTQPANIDRAQQIGAQIKCPVCQGESIADSPAQMARDMMALVEDRIDGGRSNEEIIDELLGSYSGALLLNPPASGNTLILWLAPAIAGIAGLAVIVWWKRHPGPGSTEPVAGRTSNRSRLLIGGLLVAGALAGIVVLVGGSVQSRGETATGVADLAEDELADVSNETMEAVIAANADDPQVNGMRLALADRYYEAQDYRSAFPHYFAVAESGQATPAEAVTALVRLGWMAYDGNRETETALELLDEALAIEPSSQVALYLKGTVLWCGQDDGIAAAALFRQVLDDPSLPEESRSQVTSDLETAESGAAC